MKILRIMKLSFVMWFEVLSGKERKYTFNQEAIWANECDSIPPPSGGIRLKCLSVPFKASNCKDARFCQSLWTEMDSYSAEGVFLEKSHTLIHIYKEWNQIQLRRTLKSFLPADFAFGFKYFLELPFFHLRRELESQHLYSLPSFAI